MKGLIIINRYSLPKQSVHQAERLKTEFKKRNVAVDIITDGYLYAGLFNDKLNFDLSGVGFAIYLDKDKYLSQVLESKGIRVFNKHEAIRLCDDKGQTIIALANKGVIMPKTIFAPICYAQSLELNYSDADAIIEKLSLPIVVKESFGSMGKGVHLAESKEQLVSLMTKLKNLPHIYQEYIHYIIGVDVRVIVIGKKAVAVMERCNKNDFRSNVAQGGTGVKIDPPIEFIKTAEKCAEILGLDYCGVDLLYKDDKTPVVCEVNSNAFFDGIEQVTSVNVAGLYADYVIKTIKMNNN